MGPSALSSFATDTWLRVAVPVDLDGDGKWDLVTAHQSSSSVDVLMGNGDGTFLAKAGYAAGSGLDLAVGDLDRDGRPDVIAPFRGGIGVLRGTGDGTLRAAVYCRARGTWSPAITTRTVAWTSSPWTPTGRTTASRRSTRPGACRSPRPPGP